MSAGSFIPRAAALLALLLASAVAMPVLDAAQAAIFGEDRRQAISELRKRDPVSWTDEERLILQASARVGILSCPNGEAASNASLVLLPDGRDAVITSAHSLLVQPEPASADLGVVPACDLSSVIYFPNQSFLLNDGTPVGDYQKVRAYTDGALPLNLENLTGPAPGIEADFLIFILRDRVSGDILQDGTLRGAMRLDKVPPPQSEVVLLGKNKEFQNGRTIAYEKCSGSRDRGGFFHICATTASSSSSAIVRFESGELILTAIHKDQPNGPEGVRPIPSSPHLMNGAVAIESVVRYLEESHGMVFVSEKAAAPSDQIDL